MLTRRLLGGVLAVLLLTAAGCSSPSNTATPASAATTVVKETADIAALRVKANAGDAEAQNNLGVAYENGKGVPQDDAQAVAWFRKAAEQGDATAHYNLGVMSANGQGVPQDAVSAYMWFNLAAARATGETQTRYAMSRDETAKTMTPTQIKSGQTLSREWFAAFEKRQAQQK